mmetsp:Transcript_7928/g.33361  ORF Transcript_7928/g.33361 Transcript_7928/m.33361 type:complete len:389 (-) Transcript_7928:286-1452(-)
MLGHLSPTSTAFVVGVLSWPGQSSPSFSMRFVHCLWKGKSQSWQTYPRGRRPQMSLPHFLQPTGAKRLKLVFLYLCLCFRSLAGTGVERRTPMSWSRSFSMSCTAVSSALDIPSTRFSPSSSSSSSSEAAAVALSSAPLSSSSASAASAAAAAASASARAAAAAAAAAAALALAALALAVASFSLALEPLPDVSCGAAAAASASAAASAAATAAASAAAFGGASSAAVAAGAGEPAPGLTGAGPKRASVWVIMISTRLHCLPTLKTYSAVKSLGRKKTGPKTMPQLQQFMHVFTLLAGEHTIARKRASMCITRRCSGGMRASASLIRLRLASFAVSTSSYDALMKLSYSANVQSGSSCMFRYCFSEQATSWIASGSEGTSDSSPLAMA